MHNLGFGALRVVLRGGDAVLAPRHAKKGQCKHGHWDFLLTEDYSMRILDIPHLLYES